MPTYRVETDQGTFDVELDREPSSEQELSSLVESALGGAPQAPTEDNVAAVERYLKNRPLAQGIRATLEGGGAIAGAALGAGASVPTGGTAAPATVPLATLGGYMAGRNLADVTDTWLGVKAPQTVDREVAELPQEAYEGAKQQVIGAGIGYVVQGGLGMVKGALKRAPGAQGLTVEESIAKVREIPQQIASKMPADWANANAALSRKAQIPTPNFESTVDELLQAESASDIPNRATLSLLTKLKKAMTSRRMTAPFTQTTPLNILRNDQRRLGQLSGVMEGKDGGVDQGVLRKLVEAIHRDYDDVLAAGGVAGQDVQTVLDAVKASKREFAAEEVKRIIEQSISSGKHAGVMAEDIRAGAIIDQITRKGKFAKIIEQSLPPQEIADYVKQIESLKFPALPPASGAVIGSGRVLPTVTLGTGAGLAATGGNPVGGAAGGYAAYKGTEAIQEFLMSPQGKEFLRWARARSVDPTSPGFQALAMAYMSRFQPQYQAPPNGSSHPSR